MGVLHLSWQKFKQTWKWTHFLQDKISSALTFYHSNILKLYFVEFCADPKSFFILSPIFSVLLSLHLEHRFSNPFPTFLSTFIIHLTSSLQMLLLSHFFYLPSVFFHCFSNPDTFSYVSLLTLLLSFPVLWISSNFPALPLYLISYSLCFVFSFC